MKSFLILALCLLLLLPAVVSAAASADDSMLIRVGLYENKPKIFTDDSGNPAGFWPDIINYIAAQEGWQIEYIHGTWTECLDRLEKNEIDMMPDMAYTEERDEKFDFSQEIVYVSWSRVYVKNDSNIQSILDLDGKTIAVLEGSINYVGPEGIKKLTETFNINCTFVPVESYDMVFQLLDENTVDAGVVSKDYAYIHETDFSFIETDVVFQPARLYFAFPPDSTLKTYLIDRVDNNIEALRADGDSIYYQSLGTWMGLTPIEKPIIPNWLMWLLIVIGIVALVFGGGALLLRSQVRRRTRELAQDVARREKTEKELRESQEKLGLILETIPLGLVVTDTAGKILQVNKAIMNLIGFGKKELVGENYLHFIGTKDRKRMEQNRNEATVGGGNNGQEYMLKNRDGNKFPTKITWAPIKGAEGNSIGVLALFEDMTVQKQINEERKKVVEYRELDKLRTDVLATVSHELRTPLAGIKGYTTMLMDYYHKLKRTQKWESLAAINSSTDRLADLIDHLLDISRLDSGLFKLKLQPVTLHVTLTAAINEAKLRSPKYKFNNKIDKRLPKVTADPQRLRQVIDNLIDNAVKYSKEGTEIVIRTEVRPEEILISVTDQGVGIPAAEITKIFGRFYRIEERLRKDPGGFGLGLALCKALIESHGGKIWVVSETGKGSTFYFTLPIKKKGEKKETQSRLM
ncbi:MAG: transporter substrate-binding domain-containing protein [Dehalococcoidales bacterium]|nr:transporter substrate-binding domain-containing protein [Dehalococcoidales bacterium]